MRNYRSNTAKFPLAERLEGRVFLSATALGDLHLSDLPDQHNATTSINIDGTQYFAVEPKEGVAGAPAELWRSDGSVGGTSKVHTFNLLGAYVGSDAPPISNLANIGGELFFTVKSATNQTQLELWESDGTDGGTTMVAGGFGTPTVGFTMNFTDVNGTAFFVAGSGTSLNLWKSDGTPQGTKQITTSPSFFSARNFTDVAGTLYFTSNGLWKSDGTAGGTQLVKSLSTSDTTSIQTLGGKLFFVASGVLYTSDGSAANTQPLISTNPPTVGEIKTAGNRLYLAATDATHGKELWSTDGTAPNTSVLKDIQPGTNSSSPGNFAELDNHLYFAADDGLNGRELWSSDGTIDGTTLVKDLNPSGNGNPSNFVRDASTLVFVGSDGVQGTQMWETDGSTNGTSAISGLYASVDQVLVKTLSLSGEQLFFQAIDRAAGFSQVIGDVTTGHLTVLKDLVGGPLNVAITRVARAADGKLFYVAGDTTSKGRELYLSDGTTQGTGLLKDINTVTGSSPTELVDAGGTIYFAANDLINSNSAGRELWKSDGTSSGTVLVKDINPGIADSNPTMLTALGSIVFFNVQVGTDFQLWQSQGTAATTTAVQQFGTPIGAADNMAAYNGFLYFSRNSQLWRTNGLPNGTTLIKELGDGFTFLPMRFLTSAAGFLYFQGQDTTHGKEIWRSDGTSAGTVMVRDINTDATPFNSSSPSQFTAVGNLVFFAASDGTTHGRELWKTDGTTAGTLLVKDILPGPSDSSPVQLTSFAGFLYFTADDGVHGRELWRTDGTTTLMVKDLIEGVASSNPTELTVSGARLYFAANDGIRGNELWATDGTLIYRVADVNAGAASSSPMNLTDVNGTLFFTANDGVIGPRLFSLSDDLTPPSAAQPTYNVDGPSVSVVFSEDMRDVDANDVELMNVDTGVPIDSSLLDLSSYDPATHTATFTFAGFARGELPDGNYELTLKGIDVTDIAGNSVPQDVSVDFYSLAADGKADRVVDILDFNLLAANFGKSGISFSGGNYDRSEDGLVTILDFNVLASHFGKAVAEPARPTHAIFAAAPPLALPSAQLEPTSDLLESVGLI